MGMSAMQPEKGFRSTYSRQTESVAGHDIRGNNTSKQMADPISQVSIDIAYCLLLDVHHAVLPVDLTDSMICRLGHADTCLWRVYLKLP
jgi:hypothetical protein